MNTHLPSATSPLPVADKRSARERTALAATFLAAVIVCSAGLFFDAPLDEHEALLAQTAREMRASGDWIVPRFADMPRIRKTPLGYWAVAAAGLLTGRIDEFTVRLPSAVFAAATIACLFVLARRAFGPRIGRVAAFVALTAVALPLAAANGAVDMQLTFWCTAAYLLFFEAVRARHTPAGPRWALAFHVVFAIALMAKFPMAGVVVGAPVAFFVLAMLLTRRWSLVDLGRLRCAPGLVIVLLLVLPWPLLVWHAMPDVAWQWRSEILDRFSGELRDARSTPWWTEFYYLPVMAGLALPWSLSIPAALAVPVRPRWRASPDVLLIACWLAVGLLIVSAAAFKRAHYALPTLPALLLLLAIAIDDQFFNRPHARSRAVYALASTVILLLLAAAVAVVAARESLPVPSSTLIVSVAFLALPVAAAAVLYVHRRRAAALIAVGATSFPMLALALAARVAAPDPRDDWRAFAAQVAAIVPPEHPVRWLGRHDAVGVFYGGGRLVAPRLDDPTELLKLTSGRFPSRTEWLLTIADIAVDRLRDPAPIWLIVDRDDFGLLKNVVRMPGTIALESAHPSQRQVLLVTNQPIDAAAPPP